MKATHLDQFAHECVQAEEQQKLMIEEIKRKLDMKPALERKAKELEEEIRGMREGGGDWHEEIDILCISGWSLLHVYMYNMFYVYV